MKYNAAFKLFWMQMISYLIDHLKKQLEFDAHLCSIVIHRLMLFFYLCVFFSIYTKPQAENISMINDNNTIIHAEVPKGLKASGSILSGNIFT